LPGEIAHRQMLPQGRELHPEEGKTDIIQSSVLMIIFPLNGELNTCFIRRPSGMRNHGGQIAFPGGRYETTDKDLMQTALRESFEEIGLENDQVEIIGALTPIYVQVSNFTINPYIGWCETTPEFKTDNQEVDELIILSVEKLMSHSVRDTRNVNTPRGKFIVPGYFIDPVFIWGATAMILTEFKEIYRALTT